MKQKNIAWKLVKVTPDKKMVSFVMGGKSQVEYKFGEWARPNENAANQFLFVFDTRENARKWKIGRRGERVLKVLCNNLTEDRIGTRYDEEHIFNSRSVRVDGTLFADAVKVIGRG